jgi:hypothetical protein
MMNRRRLGIVLASLSAVLIVVAGVLAYDLLFTGAPGTPGSPTTPGPSGGGGGPCTAASPYGFTTINADNQLVTLYRQLNVCWVRLQVHEDQIQVRPGVYNWSNLDAAVATLNAAGIHIDFPLECFGGSCFSHPRKPTIAQMTRYATAVATRYDGTHGHGKIDAFEIGNEEYDFFDPAAYGPLLKAGYQAIKAVYPGATVGMYGTFNQSLAHIQAVMQSVANGYSSYLDFANFHYYAHGGDPRITESNHPSFNEEWQAIHSILPNKPIWVTEVGWTTTPLAGMQVVSPQTQAEYLQYVTEQAAASGVIQRIFWFTINYGNQGDTVYPPSGPKPAFYTLKALVQQRPLWN